MLTPSVNVVQSAFPRGAQDKISDLSPSISNRRCRPVGGGAWAARRPAAVLRCRIRPPSTISRL